MNPAPYRRPYWNTQPEYLFPKYASTVKRAPLQPLIVLPHTLSEVTAPVFGYDDVKPSDSDLTKQHKAEPQGEQIAFLSEHYTLEPGDVIYTGTPAGVGPVKPGDELLAGIDGVSELKVKIAPAL